MRQQRFSRRQHDAVRQRIHDSSEQALTIEGLAKELGLSSSHFMSLFSNSFGLSPWQYVLRVRLSKVCALLASSSQSVTDIALSTGFSTPSHMSASFRRHFGLTPLAYRRLREVSRSKAP
jgi:AraC family transcriptional regulator